MINEKERKQSFFSTIKSAKYMFGFVWKERLGKLYLLMQVFAAFVSGVFPLAVTIIPGLIINELMGAMRTDILILYVGILTGVPVAEKIIGMILTKCLHKLGNSLGTKFNADFFDHVASMDYETLEKPDIQVMRERAGYMMNRFMWTINSSLSGILSAFFALIAMSSIIVTLNPFIIVLMVIVIFVNSLAAKRMNQKQYLVGLEVSKNWRRTSAFIDMFWNFQHAKEFRLFNLKSFVVDMFVKNQTEAHKLHLKNSMFQEKTNVLNSVTNLIQQIAIYAYVIYNVIARGLAIGSMAIYIAAMERFSNSLNQIMGRYIEFSRQSLDIQEMIDFMNIPSIHLETGNKTPIFDKNSTIEFKNVSFKYPGSENYALKDMSITIRGDEKLCIVGANGSGKSTFVKLLTRLYMPTEGEISLNGVNITEYDYIKYQRLFAPVFQDFSKFPFSLRDNIVLASEYNQQRLNEVSEQSGLMPLVNKMPKGFDTQVTKQIDNEGFEPSGGEGQRIAIARAVYHGAPIFLLDEPTAALDPIAEYEIYTQFSDMITDKAAVLITHRLSAVQLADKVAVFEAGGLIEYGTHKQLYNNGGTYTEMYKKQAEFYIED